MSLYILFHSATSLSPVCLERGIFMCLYVLFHSATSLSPVFLERGIFMCLYVLFHSAFVINRLPGMLLPMRCEFPTTVTFRVLSIRQIDNVEPPLGLLWVMRCDFPIDNIQVSGRVHLTNRTNRSNRQRWTAPGSVVSNEMRFSAQQNPRFGSCPFDELDESVESTTLNRRVCCQ